MMTEPLSVTASAGIAERILDSFPSGTYALSGLLRLLEVVESTEVPTAAVECRAAPRLLVNPEFVETWAATPEKLMMLVMHELHHVLLGHTRLFPCASLVDNFVFDAVINALLSRMFPAPEHTSLFTDYYYASSFPECLLRPPAGWNGKTVTIVPEGIAKLGAKRGGVVADVYRGLYSEAGATYKEIFDVLRTEVDERRIEDVDLLGDHSEGGAVDGMLEGSAPILLDAVREVVERWPQPPEPIQGRSLSEIMKQETVRAVRRPSNRTVLGKLLRRIGGVTGSTGSVLGWRDDDIRVDSPIPVAERRGIVLRSLGLEPIFYQGFVRVPRRVRSGEKVHVYLDVSGSISELKGALYGAVLDTSAFVHPVVHLFSTEVADVTLGELRRGICKTTGGTHIDCVAKHIADHRIRRACLITDGFVGRPSGRRRDTLSRIRLGVALIDGNCTRDDLAEVADAWAVFT